MLALVCLDPGFASIGYARIVIPPLGPPFVEAFGVFHTVKSDKKQKVLATEDNVKRAMMIARFLRQLATSGTGRTIAICAEAMSFPRSSSVAAKMALTWGSIASLSEASSIPILQTSPQNVKRTLCGVASATKEEVQEALEKLYPETIRKSREMVDAGMTKAGKTKKKAAIKKTDFEHCFDALAVGHVMLESDVVKMTRRAT